ncbi:response regulator [Spirosoma sp. HMF4905]|uniref:Response regulator n=1 Tax=Spirosoma arboris TaxID=2682092 RepID=A0A7K1SBR5_9BACT|nr:response regulator [Spirosoma arboris]MVM31230.1 response regulator [Spirosoma arboris]
MESDQRSLRKKALPLLVIENNEDHQLLIGYCLRTKIPQVEPIFASTVNETLAFLKLSVIHKKIFPSLILLDLYLPKLTDGFNLLKEIRTSYPPLPVIVLSTQSEAGLVEKAYALGAHSFLTKPFNLDEWENLFKILNEYWLGTVTLPKGE